MVGRKNKIKRARTNGRLGKRGRAAAEIRRSEAYMAEGQRLTRTGTWALNVVTKRCFWSPELFRILEFDPASTDPSISTFLDQVHPSDRGAAQQNIDLVIHTGKDFAQDYRLLLGGGTTKYVHSIGRPITNKFGEIIEIIGAATEFTDRFHASPPTAASQQMNHYTRFLAAPRSDRGINLGSVGPLPGTEPLSCC